MRKAIGALWNPAWLCSVAGGILCSIALPASAQTARGTVVDAATSAPLAEVEVVLLSQGDSVVERLMTDARGRFRARFPDDKQYRLQATRLGYEPAISDAIVVGPGQAARVELRLNVDPILMDPIEVIARGQSVPLTRAGFYQREAIGFGQIRTPEDIEAKPPHDLEDLFRGFNGLQIVRTQGADHWTLFSTRGVRSMDQRTTEHRCRFSVSIDQQVVEVGRYGATESSGWQEGLQVVQVAALEVYSGPSGIPGWAAGSDSPCGAVIIWTKGYARR